MQTITKFLYSIWQQVPVVLRPAIRAFLVALVAAGLAFGWHFPTDLADAKVELAAFWLVIVPTAYGLAQRTLWPALVAWFLSLLDLAPTIEGKALTAKWHPSK